MCASVGKRPTADTPMRKSHAPVGRRQTALAARVLCRAAAKSRFPAILWVMTRLFAFLGLGIGLTVGCGGDDFSSDGSGGASGNSGTGNASATGGSGNTAGTSGAGNAGGSSGAGNAGGTSGAGNAAGSGGAGNAAGSGGSGATGGSTGTGGDASGGTGGSATGGATGSGGATGTGGSATGGATGTGGSATGGTGGTDCAAVNNPNLKLHSTLDNAAAVTGPAAGSPGWVNNVSFPGPGKCGTGAADFPAGGGHGLKFPITGAVLAEGSVDFYLKASDLCSEIGPNNRYLFHKPGPGTGLAITLLVQNPVAEIHVAYSPNATGPYTAKASFTCDLNKWTRVTATWNSMVGNVQPVQLYFDGVLQDSSSTAPTASVSVAGNPNFYVGAKSGYVQGANAKIDELKVYDAVITP